MVRRPEAFLTTCFLILSMGLSACTSEAPATSVVMPEFLTTATAEVDGEVIMPTPQSIPIEGNQMILDIQEDCREYILEPQADMCVGLVLVDGLYVWTGVLSSYYNPGTIYRVEGYKNDQASIVLFEGATGPENDFVSINNNIFDPDGMTLVATIGGYSEQAFLTTVVSAESNEGQVLWLLTVPQPLRQAPPDSDGPST